MSQSAVKQVAFIGLGVMGYPMAGHLAAKGYQVTVFNRTQEKADHWTKQHGGKSAPTPAEAAAGAQAVFACVGDHLDHRALYAIRNAPQILEILGHFLGHHAFLVLKSLDIGLGG